MERTDGRTDGETPDGYITLTARRSQFNNEPIQIEQDGNQTAHL